MEAALAAYGGVQNAKSATLETLLQRARTQAKVPVPEEKVKRCEEFVARAGGSFQSSREKATDGVGALRRPGKVGQVARRVPHEREPGSRASQTSNGK